MASVHPLVQRLSELLTRGKSEPYAFTDAAAERLEDAFEKLPEDQVPAATQGVVLFAYVLENKKKSKSAARVILSTVEAVLKRRKLKANTAWDKR